MLAGLESIDPTGIRLIGGAYTRIELRQWVDPAYRDAFVTGIRELASSGFETHTGRHISSDSNMVAGGIEAQADAIPPANEALVRKGFRLGTHRTVRLDHDDGARWDDQVAAFLVANLRSRPDRVRVEAQGVEAGVASFRVWLGEIDVGFATVNLDTHRVTLDVKSAETREEP